MADKSSCAALYPTHDQADEAVRVLQKAAFDIKKISIVGRGYHQEQQPVGFYNTGERVKFWGGQSAFWGGLWGVLLGAAMFWIPGLGPVVMAGPLVVSLVDVLEGSVVVAGVSALGAALYSIGIPKESIIRYEAALKSDHYLIVVHGNLKEVERAHEVLAPRELTDAAIHLS